jgi:hypothetical protein
LLFSLNSLFDKENTIMNAHFYEILQLLHDQNPALYATPLELGFSIIRLKLLFKKN